MEAESTHAACATGRHRAGIELGRGGVRPQSAGSPALTRGLPKADLGSPSLPPLRERARKPASAAARRGIGARWALRDLVPPPPWGLGFLAELPTSDPTDGLITLQGSALRRPSGVGAQRHSPRPRRPWMGAAAEQGRWVPVRGRPQLPRERPRD